MLLDIIIAGHLATDEPAVNPWTGKSSKDYRRKPSKVFTQEESIAILVATKAKLCELLAQPVLTPPNPFIGSCIRNCRITIAKHNALLRATQP